MSWWQSLNDFIATALDEVIGGGTGQAPSAVDKIVAEMRDEPLDPAFSVSGPAPSDENADINPEPGEPSGDGPSTPEGLLEDLRKAMERAGAGTGSSTGSGVKTDDLEGLFGKEDNTKEVQDFLNNYATTDADIAELYRLLTRGGFISVPTFLALQKTGATSNIRQELLSALDSAFTTMSYSNETELSTFLQRSAAGVTVSELRGATDEPTPPNPADLKEVAEDQLQSLTGFARPEDVRNVAGAYQFDEGEGADPTVQAERTIEATMGEQVLGRRALSAVDVLREMVGL